MSRFFMVHCVHSCSKDSRVVMQRAVRRHLAVLQMERDHLKTELTAQCSTVPLTPPKRCKLELLFIKGENSLELILVFRRPSHR